MGGGHGREEVMKLCGMMKGILGGSRLPIIKLERDEVEHGMGRESASVCIQVHCLVTDLLGSVDCQISIIWLYRKDRNLRIEDLPHDIQVRQNASFNTRH